NFSVFVGRRNPIIGERGLFLFKELAALGQHDFRAPRLAATYQDSEARAGRHAQGHHLDHRAIVARRSVSRRHRKPQGSSCLPRSSSKNHLSAEGVRFAFAGRPKPAVQPAAWIPPSQTKGFNAGTAPPARASARRLAERRFPRLWRWYPPLR